MDNRDLRANNPRCFCSGSASSEDPHSPYLSHWTASYTSQEGYGIDIDGREGEDKHFLQWDWTDVGDDWETDYLPDLGDLNDNLELRQLWGMRGCALGITDSGDYMVAGTARLDMTGYDPEERIIIEDYQLFLAVFDDASIDGPYNQSLSKHGITSENWWLVGTPDYDEGVSIRKWASGTCLPSNALVVVGTQRREIRPETWRVFVGYRPYGSGLDSIEQAASPIDAEPETSNDLAVFYSSSDHTIKLCFNELPTGLVSLELYNLAGRLSGSTSVNLIGERVAYIPLSLFDGNQFPNGVYHAVIRSSQATDVSSFVLVR